MSDNIYYDGMKWTLISIHFLTICSFFILNKVNIKTIIFQIILTIFSMLTITGGYHRLWSHKSYEAGKYLQYFYAFFGIVASQKSAIWWVKAHRTHHRNEEAPGDPYNINKGFYNAHIGWLIHGNDKIEKEEIYKTDVNDLEKNDILLIQNNYYTELWIFIFILCVILPILFWNEKYLNSLFINFFRIIIVWHMTYSVNSFAHYIGDKPYNSKLKACENLLVSIITFGEGWHNYHHSYPKDYRASEKNKFNPTTWFINLTKYFGLSSNHYIKDRKYIPNSERFNLDYYKLLS